MHVSARWTRGVVKHVVGTANDVALIDPGLGPVTLNSNGNPTMMNAYISLYIYFQQSVIARLQLVDYCHHGFCRPRLEFADKICIVICTTLCIHVCDFLHR